ncbi:DUF802 domain-containing protein [Variovorax sp. Root411]|uniref:DUF802 domain-containing protein n=1 Tax=Variovorax sp. Root411 TaxID=1736530 RepID=UPI0006F5A424|nr:DUF802 domain-containing protein [Variovorax sp. Root411]KQW63497.1 hypothetical protein ASC92_23245 [Variovorax sp. Root411]
MTRFLQYAVFVAGLAVVGWVGAGYIGTNPLALAVTAIIGASYLMGALELHRFQQATSTLTQAVADLSAPPESLGAWLGRLHPSLQNAVRLRIEGERVGLPGPAMTPYLAGFLVLLGMLGTFVGMVVTLKGTGLALESSTDLQTIRDSLSAPVKGLGLAFGTSVAGVAASAMLGLASALSRRERLQAGQLLDTQIATTLRVFSLTHQREESFKLLQQQAHAMPELVGQLQAMMLAMERQSHALNERLATSQDHFHSKAEAVYGGLASSVDQSLKQSLTESARVAGAAIQPVVEATMAGIARETATLHDTISQTVQQQLDGLSSRFEATTTRVADTWKTALAEHQRTSEALSKDMRGSHDQFAQTFEQRSAALVDTVSARLESAVGNVSDTWGSALAQHQRVSEKLSGDAHQALSSVAAAFAQHAASLLHTVDGAHAKLQTDMASRDEQRLAAWTQSLTAMAASLQKEWQEASAHNASQQQQLLDTMAQAARDMSAQTEAHAKNTVAEIAQLLQAASEAPRAAAEIVSEMASRDEQRLLAWTQSLATMAASLQQEWQQAGAHNASQQQQLIDAMAQTARDMSAQTEAHAKNTVAEIAQLLQAAAEAPRAAAEVVTELRQKLADSMTRDNAMLEERSRILETLATLLDAVNHASTEQRAAIDTLVSASADLLERVGSRFTEKADAESEKMAAVAAQITGSAVEVASLGEAFGLAVQLFSQSNDKLVGHLQRIEGALGKSITRSDEQLAYYVAQAREVIDLSIMSQKQIVEDMQQIASRQQQQAPVDSEA